MVLFLKSMSTQTPNKVGAISKAQKAQKTFLKKNLKFLIFFQKMSHSAKKCKRRETLDFINIYSVAKYQKTRKGDSFETLKNFRKKVAQCRKQIERGGTLVSSGFVGYVKIVKNERGDPFALISADRTWPYGSSFISFDCKKSDPIRVRL